MASKRKRNYRKEYDDYHGKEGPKKDRLHRNQARAKMKERGIMMSGLEVHHKDGNPRNNNVKNLSVVTPKYNKTHQNV
jgi:hypothetical protein